MNLSELLATLPPGTATTPSFDPEIISVTADSRQVTPGALFVALSGATVDGHRFLADAAARGAAALVGSTAPPPEAARWSAPYLRVADTRRTLALLAAALHGFPARALPLVGVTGTDGKTTTSNLLYHLLHMLELQPGMISTVGARIGQAELDTGLHVTTPDAPDIQRYLAQMVAQGCRAAVLETTSHGLHQGRVAAIDFDVALVTNITHEHLDYHGTWQAYLEAKALLFHSLMTGASKPLLPNAQPELLHALGSSNTAAGRQPKAAILNADDASWPHLRAIPAELRIPYGITSAEAVVRAVNIAYQPTQTTFTVQTPVGDAAVRLPLPGPFNVYNTLAALSAGLALGLPLAALAAAIATMPGVDGRMERIDRGQTFSALVDFAHTPVSLQRALEAVRPMTAGRIIAVFGSAGLRDVHKRGLMAETAVRLADFSIFTAEDPRSESLELILEQMAEGARRAGGVEGRAFVRIPDRNAAIAAGVEQAQPGDVLLVCGKGHEQSMCFGTVEHPWRDQHVLAWALDRSLGRTTAPSPFPLPTTR
ncbi:MAG: UDP-N-acetylmuramoyl-L-alanyl-D-glutamate--2,6-diaminopimelate ligase [Caldilineales bacterium]